jgi:hypothetical protein
MISFIQGIFKVKNKDKYIGNTTEIVYRSSWELKYMMNLDHDKDVLKWSSESIIIPYVSPIDNRIHRYFPDFYVEKLNISGIIEKLLIEIKPLKEISPPKKPKRMTKRFINESMTFDKNIAKWKAAKDFCDLNGFKFIILTEQQLFGKK